MRIQRPALEHFPKAGKYGKLRVPNLPLTGAFGASGVSVTNFQLVRARKLTLAVRAKFTEACIVGTSGRRHGYLPRQGASVVVTSPTVRQRELGKRLRELRNQRGLTVEDVAEKLLCTTTKISRLETGARRPSLRDVRDLCDLYQVDEATSAEFMSMARAAREQVWWTQYLDLNLDPYLGLEQDAAAITSFTTYYVPALLQTEDYTREVIRTIAPKMDSDMLRQRIEARMRRQAVLIEENPPRYRVLLDEAVLHRRVGGPTVMIPQLDKILEAARNDKATIQVVPFDAGVLAAQDSNFVLLEFAAESNLTPTVFVEGLTGNQYFERSSDIGHYREAIDYLRDSGLSPSDSIQRITEVRKAYSGELDFLL